MSGWYPLRFRPVLKQYLWGGRLLGELYGKSLGTGDDYAESWEIVDREPEQSVVINGPLAGQSLGELFQREAAALLGGARHGQRFPLLVKLLDARQLLSVQVHPNDVQAARRTPPDLGKTEVWYVLRTEPGAKLYAGLKRGFDRAALERELSRGTCELCLHSIEPRVGDTIFIPPGTVHALGAGLVIAEFQQSSDVTLRLFDWNRLGPDGQPRPLHLQEGLATINYERGPIQPIRNSVLLPDSTVNLTGEQILSCDKFDLRRRRLSGAANAPAEARCRIWLITAGELNLCCGLQNETLRVGDTVLLPAACEPVQVESAESAEWLECLPPG